MFLAARFGMVPGMEKLTDLLSRVEALATETGVKPETICRDATGNWKLYARLKRRIAQTDADMQRIERHLEKRRRPQVEAAE